jgi:hypothetical protein
VAKSLKFGHDEYSPTWKIFIRVENSKMKLDSSGALFKKYTSSGSFPNNQEGFSKSLLVRNVWQHFNIF